MNKGTDLIQRQQIEVIDGYPTGNVYIGLTLEELAELEKELKAFEIIKEKSVDITTLMDCHNAEEYNRWVDVRSHYHYRPFELTQEEFDLLKEVLL